MARKSRQESQLRVGSRSKCDLSVSLFPETRIRYLLLPEVTRTWGKLPFEGQSQHFSRDRERVVCRHTQRVSSRLAGFFF